MVPTATHPPPDERDVVVRSGGARVARGGTVVLDLPPLTIRRGQVTALVGPNGSSKSTFLHAIAGLLPVEGDLTVLGRRPAPDRSAVAYVLQAQATAPHLPVTVQEVVDLARHRRIGRRAAPEDRAAVERAIERMELGTLRRRRLHELSGGQRQRVLVAQGLAQDAPLLLLDEPTAGLDLASAARISDVVRDERRRGRAVVLATHDLTEAAEADVVGLLAGRVVAWGPPGSALTDDALLEAYAGRLLRVGRSAVVVDGTGSHRVPAR